MIQRPYGFLVPYRTLFHKFENILLKHQGRPHWAKAHGLKPADLRKSYPKFDEFVKVLEDVDGEGVFRNEYVKRHVFGEEGAEVEESMYRK